MIRSKVVTVDNFSDRTFDGRTIECHVRDFEARGFQLGQIIVNRAGVLLHFTKEDPVAVA